MKIKVDIFLILQLFIKDILFFIIIVYFIFIVLSIVTDVIFVIGHFFRSVIIRVACGLFILLLFCL
jgi:hypothetical protein